MMSESGCDDTEERDTEEREARLVKQREYNREYYAANLERERQRVRENARRERQRVRENARRERQQNPERIAERKRLARENETHEQCEKRLARTRKNSREYRRKNGEKRRAQEAEYRERNRERLLEKAQARYVPSPRPQLTNEERRKRNCEKCRRWKAKNRAAVSAKAIESYRTDIIVRLAHALRSRVRCAIKNNQKAGSAVRDLGCKIPELKIHLESLFTEGMAWDNWGHTGNVWHIDHIVPLASFNLTDRDQLLTACHYTNLQPPAPLGKRKPPKGRTLLDHGVYFGMINKSTIIRRLKVNVAEMVRLRHTADVLESTVFSDTFLWATAVVSDGTARDIAHACEILADTLKTHRPDTVRNWYQNGKFMAENNLRADKADRRIIRDIASSQSKIRRSTMLKVVDMLKKGRPYSEIKSLLRNEAPSIDIMQKASGRITSLQTRRGSLNNEQLLKLEMRVVEGLAKEVYGKVVYVTIEDKDGNVLATSDRKRARRYINETSDERKARLKKERQWWKNRTPEQKEVKRQIDKKNRQTRQANETSDERKARRQGPR